MAGTCIWCNNCSTLSEKLSSNDHTHSNECASFCEHSKLLHIYLGSIARDMLYLMLLHVTKSCKLLQISQNHRGEIEVAALSIYVLLSNIYNTYYIYSSYLICMENAAGTNFAAGKRKTFHNIMCFGICDTRAIVLRALRLSSNKRKEK